MAERLLVVEDEPNVGSTLVERLKREGFDVTWSKSVGEALAAAAGDPFALALLDVGLPDGSGFELAGRLREARPATAIIFLTAFGNPEDRVRGLELGAEDYVVKPFHLKELLLRINRSLARARALKADAATSAPTIAEIGRARIDFAGFSAEVDGRHVALTHKECDLLKLLVDRRGQVVSRDEILDRVWSEDEFPSPRTVDNFIMRLRRLVEIDPENPTVIRSVRGVGYMLERKESEK